MAKILIVDDEPRIRELIRENLQYSGYTCEEAGDGSAALSLLTGGGYDLVILDLMMPFMDGMTCLREMRTRRINTPVIILTARGEEYDKLAGLEGGADDYVVKPFSPRELVARVKAVLNRTMPRTEASDSTMTFGELSIDTASHTVKVSGEEVSLTPKEFDLLVFLASNKGIALSREKFCRRCGTMTTSARTAPWTPTSRCCAAIWASAAATSPLSGASATSSTPTRRVKRRLCSSCGKRAKHGAPSASGASSWAFCASSAFCWWGCSGF